MKIKKYLIATFVLVILWGCGGGVVIASEDRTLTSLEEEVIAELNLVRADPATYAKKYLKDLSGEAARECYEEFLETTPIGKLRNSKGMSRAARDLALDQSKNGRTGHDSSDGSNPFERMERYGSWMGSAGENVSYGMARARAIVLQLVIDEGVPSRGHRKNILAPNFTRIGVAYATHTKYRHMFVMDFANDFIEAEEK
ncbi:MAG: CAP domain-containing protein [Deltaproteobacteria bacterium]|nr:CAP domain-containing protein [Deltaproteobacteria bacterium]